MDTIERTLQLAKANKLTRSELYAKICLLAEAQRQPGKSEAQAFSKFINTPEGSKLYQLYKSLPGRDTEPSAPVNKSGGDDDWDRLIALTSKAAGCSYSQAIAGALATEADRDAFAKRKRSDQIATGQFTVADMQYLDGAAAEQEQNRELHKRDLKSDYEAKFDEAKQMYPHLSDSKIHDFVRARHPEAWEDHKLGKLGGRRLPQGHVPQPGDEHPARRSLPNSRRNY
jgi:hypothetical protein